MVSFSVAVLALINSMVGSAIIILPVMAINNGLLTTFAIIILTAIAACYSNYVTLEHISENELGYKEAVHRHSKKQDHFSWYTLFVFLSTELLFYLYFNLIMKQWSGLFFRISWLLPYLPYLTLVTLIIITLAVKKIHFGVSLMALGVISTLTGVVFMFWMYATRPEQHTHEFQLYKDGSLIDLITLLVGAYSIQNVFIDILRLHPVRENYMKIIIATYISGMVIYLIIALIGGYGIIDRHPVIIGASTIMGYFYASSWQPFILQLIFLVHLYSVWPQWGVVNAKRLMQLLQTQEQEWKTNTYLIFTPFVAFILYMFSVNLTVFINLNGGVCLVFAIFVIPFYVHIKCRYLEQKSIQCRQYSTIQWQEAQQQCIRKRQQTSTSTKYIDLITLAILSVYGMCIFLLTIKKTFSQGIALQK